MKERTKGEAQKRADEIQVFRLELEQLERDKVLALSADQRAAVSRHHESLLAEFARQFDIDRDSRDKQLSLGMRIASFLGALAMAASVFFLFYQFWGLFTTPLQVGILITSAVATFVATLVVQGHDPTGYFTKLSAMVAFACFVLNVVMLGQIFNITPSDKALLPWAALAFLLAYACDLRLLQAAGIACIIALISARVGTWSGMYWIHFGERPENFFPAALLFLALPQLINHDRFAGFTQIYRVFGLLTLFLPMLILANWGDISYLKLEVSLIEGFYQVAGFTVSAAAIWLGVRRHWSEVVNTGITFFVIFFYTKFYDWWWDVMPKWLFFLVLGLTAILFLVVMRRLRGTSSAMLRESNAA